MPFILRDAATRTLSSRDIPHWLRLRNLDARVAQKVTQMKFIRRMNEQPSSWLLLFATSAIGGYLLYLIGDGMNW